MSRPDPDSQATIKEPFSVAGVGIHTGVVSKITVKPTPPNTGIVFHNSGTVIEASVDNVSNTKHGVTLKSGKVEVRTCEHLLSALYGMGIDNAICEIDGVEVPALDGSSLGFAQLIQSNGVEPQGVPRKWFEIKEPLFLSRETASIFAVQDNEFKLSFLISYPHPGITTQYANFTLNAETYFKEIASSRTYSFVEWVDELKRKGLIQGGSLDNAIVITDKGPITKLRFADEPVRHKILDLIGDMALLGVRFRGWLFAIKSGHTLNIELVRRLKCNLT